MALEGLDRLWRRHAHLADDFAVGPVEAHRVLDLWPPLADPANRPFHHIGCQRTAACGDEYVDKGLDNIRRRPKKLRALVQSADSPVAARTERKSDVSELL